MNDRGRVSEETVSAVEEGDLFRIYEGFKLFTSEKTPVSDVDQVTPDAEPPITAFKATDVPMQDSSGVSTVNVDASLKVKVIVLEL